MQIEAHHIEESKSPWKPSVFAVKKKIWKIANVTDLRAVSEIMKTMGPLQSGIPLPSLLPKGWPLIVIDLKESFFTIHLQEKDREKIAFTVPVYL